MFPITFHPPTALDIHREIFNKPMAVLTSAAEKGVDAITEEVEGNAIINAPWHSGATTNAIRVWTRKRLGKFREARGVVASRVVAVDKRAIDSQHYYPFSVHFGWSAGETQVAPDPWLLEALDQARSVALSIYRNVLRRELGIANKGISGGPNV